ncbi:motility associated factor glycosyltransferase family protein [Motilimonas sp. 1_MG-2023]|nr:6-hydroxymethylpterin diphosphokinase MptE-like protein [Motilimonas sp. 1_MG-2023]
MNKLSNSLAIIAKRWPELYQPILSSPTITPVVIHEPEPTYVIDDIQLTSCYQRESEAQLQANSVPTNCSKLNIYGVALGDTINAVLTNKQLKLVKVHILNLSVFKLTLSDLGSLGWLDDPRVELVYAGGSNGISRPYLVMPAELILADDDCARLRDKLILDRDSAHIESQHTNNQHAQQHIITTQAVLKHDRDAEELLNNTFKRALIIAAGPSLEQTYQLIKNHQTGDIIICVDAALRALKQEGIIPNIVISIDPHPEICFRGIDFKEYTEVSLVYFPRMSPDTLSQWLGPRYQAYSTSSLYDDVNQKCPRLRLFSGGSVIHPAIDLAVKMSAAEVILFGADFGYPSNKTHAFWPSNFDVPAVNSTVGHSVMSWRGNKISTLPNLRGYLRDLEDFIELHPEVNFYSASSLGAKIDGARLWNEVQHNC